MEIIDANKIGVVPAIRGGDDLVYGKEMAAAARFSGRIMPLTRTGAVAKERGV
jgi:hypothetical protein